RSAGAAQARLVGVSEELGLQGRHVHVHRAVVRAALAREAEVERLEDLVVLPDPFDGLALEQLEEQMGAAACRVLLVARDHEARAHDAALRAPALPDPDAANR